MCPRAAWRSCHQQAATATVITTANQEEPNSPQHTGGPDQTISSYARQGKTTTPLDTQSQPHDSCHDVVHIFLIARIEKPLLCGPQRRICYHYCPIISIIVVTSNMAQEQHHGNTSNEWHRRESMGMMLQSQQSCSQGTLILIPRQAATINQSTAHDPFLIR